MAKKSARQSPTVEEVIEEVNNVLDSHHSRLSDALVNSLEKFSEKMFEKNLIPEPVKNTPESVNKVLTSFKANFGFIRQVSVLREKLESFLKVLRDLRGAPSIAADVLEEDFEKAFDDEPESTSRDTLLANYDSTDYSTVKELKSMHADPLSTSTAAFHANTSDGKSIHEPVSEVTDQSHMNSHSVTEIDKEYSQIGEQAQNKEDSLNLARIAATTRTQSLHSNPQHEMVVGNDGENGIPVSKPPRLDSSKVSLDVLNPLPSSRTCQPSQESGDDSVQVSTPRIDNLHSSNSGNAVVLGSKEPVSFCRYQSCPEKEELNALKEHFLKGLQSENEDLKEKVKKLEEEKDKYFRNEKLRLEEDRKKFNLEVRKTEKRLEKWELKLGEREDELKKEEKEFKTQRRNSEKDLEEQKFKLREHEQSFSLEKEQQASVLRKSSDGLDEKAAKLTAKELQQNERESSLDKYKHRMDRELLEKEKRFKWSKKKQEQDFKKMVEKFERTKSQSQQNLEAERQTMNQEREKMESEMKRLKDEIASKEKKMKDQEAIQIQEIREREKKLDQKEHEMKERERELTDMQLSQVVKHQKEQEKIDTSRQELKAKWREYWDKEQFNRERNVKRSKQSHKDRQQQLLGTKQLYFLWLLVVLCLVLFVGICIFIIVRFFVTI